MTATAHSPAGLHLALEVDGDGAHPSSWRFADRPPEAVATAYSPRSAVADAQAAGFALATFAGGPLGSASPPEAADHLAVSTRAAHASTATDRIGLAPLLHAPMTDPSHLVTALERAGRDRAGWIVGAATGLETQISADHPICAALHRNLLKTIALTRELWDPWAEQASPSSPGRLTVLAPDALEIDESADVVLVARPDIAAVGERARQARRAGAGLAFAEVEFLLDADAPAADRLAALDHPQAWPATHALRHIGSVSAFIDMLRSLAGVVDGLRLHPAVLSVDLPVLVERVLPALAAEGLLRPPPQPGETLRATLGLAHPHHRRLLTASRVH